MMRVRTSENKLVSLALPRDCAEPCISHVYGCTHVHVCVHVSHTHLSVPAGNEADQDGHA